MIKLGGTRRVQILLFSVGLSLGALSSVGCKREKIVQKSPVPDKAVVQRAHQELSNQVADLVSGFKALKNHLEMIPFEVPGVVQAKEKLASAESVLGVADARSRWLGDELDSALKSGDGEQLRSVFAQIQAAESDIKHIKKLGIEVAHQIPPYDPDAARKPWKHVLPNGVELRAFEGGVEDQLIRALVDKKTKLGPASWFTCDRVPLEAPRADFLAARSKAQLENLAQILKAYPRLKIAIGGFTDSSGSAEVNKKHSQERASAVRAQLAKLGVLEDRLRADGLGGENLACPARDGEGCLEQNRRIAILVTQK